MMIGILGGLGPVASCRFYDILNSMCCAQCDQDYPDVMIYSKASVPDRTAYLLGQSEESPLPAMIAGLQALERAGAGVLAVPCATAHHFYDALQAAVNTPVLNMLALTANALASEGVTRVGLLCTQGSYASGAFASALERTGIAAVTPDEAQAARLMRMIYDIKLGSVSVHIEEFAKPLFEQDVQRIILGCTELSMFHGQDERYVDPMQILAQEILRLCKSQMY